MLNKTIIVLTVFIVGLMAISAVSAQTNTAEDIVGTDNANNVVESNDETILDSSQNNDLLNKEKDNDINEPSPVDTDSDKLKMGSGEVLGNKIINVTGDSFTDIEDAISGSSDGDIIYLNGGYYKGNKSITLSKKITIIGGSEPGDGKYATLDAQHLSRIFFINSHVTLRGIKFINGYTNSGVHGGAIYVNHYGFGDPVTLIDCIFENNHADYRGGAVYWSGRCNVAIINCTFENNSARDGGANYFHCVGNIKALTGNFINNIAKTTHPNGGYGGANYFDDVQVSDINIEGNFINNSAEGGSGGANYFWAKVTKVRFTGNFINNSANYGGANYFHEVVSNFNLAGNFINNYVKNWQSGPSNQGYGGANYFNDKLTSVTFIGNYINNKGPDAIYIANSESTSIRDSIFINNAPILINRGPVAFTDVWFGNNATNYNVKPDVGRGVILSNWLFLNAAADSNPISAVDTSNIIFKLSRYDGGTVSEYDNSRLIPINLTVTSTLGSVNPELANLNESITYTPNSSGKGSVTASIENVLCTIEIENLKADPGLSMDPQEITCTNNTVIVLNFNDLATGTVNITLKGNRYSKTYECLVLNATILLEGDILPDEYNITVIYSGDAIFNNASCNSTLKINKIEDYTMDINSTAPVVGENATVTVNLPSNAGGNVTVVDSEGNSHTGTVQNDGIAVVEVQGLPAGDNKLNITYSGDERYATKTVEYEVNVNKADPGLSMDSQEMTYTNNTVISLYFNASATGTVNITLKGNKYNKTYENLALNATILLEGDILPDEYQVTVIYSGDETFKNASCNSTLKINKIDDYTLDINSTTPVAGENATVTVTLPSNAEGNVTVTDAQGNNYTGPVEGGCAVVEVPNLPSGDNNITVTYSGDDRYEGNTAKSEVHVDKMATFLYAKTFEMYQGDGTKYVVNLTDITGKPIKGMGIKVNITGKTYTIITDENGTAVLPINLKAGVHPATAFFNGNGDYANASPVSTDVNVLTKVRIDQHKDLIKDYGDSDKFTVHAVDKYGKSVGAYAKVKMTIAGKTYTVFTDAQGYASLPINLKPGTYDITCEYAGYTVKHKVTVKQVLSATNIQYKKASSYKFTATLKHSNGKAISGKTVTFTVKGKTYTQTTNANGEATITIKETLNLGKYNIMIKYIDSAITKLITIK